MISYDLAFYRGIWLHVLKGIVVLYLLLLLLLLLCFLFGFFYCCCCWELLAVCRKESFFLHWNGMFFLWTIELFLEVFCFCFLLLYFFLFFLLVFFCRSFYLKKRKLFYRNILVKYLGKLISIPFSLLHFKDFLIRRYYKEAQICC